MNAYLPQSNDLCGKTYKSQRKFYKGFVGKLYYIFFSTMAITSKVIYNWEDSLKQVIVSYLKKNVSYSRFPLYFSYPACRYARGGLFFLRTYIFYLNFRGKMCYNKGAVA